MGLDKCPICGKKSYIKAPASRIMRESLGVMVHVADKHYWECLDCGHKSERVRVNTKAGDYFELPWYERLFKSF